MTNRRNLKWLSRRIIRILKWLAKVLVGWFVLIIGGVIALGLIITIAQVTGYITIKGLGFIMEYCIQPIMEVIIR